MECSRVEMLKKISAVILPLMICFCILIPIRMIKRHSKCFQALVKKTKELKCEYEEKFGPLNQFSTAMQDEFNWLDNPWPWKRRLISNV